MLFMFHFSNSGFYNKIVVTHSRKIIMVVLHRIISVMFIDFLFFRVMAVIILL